MIALLLWMLTPAVLAETLQGIVREYGNGDPIEGAFVRVAQGQFESGPDGTFSLELPPGSHDIVAGSFEHEPTPFVVEVPHEGMLELFVPRSRPMEIVVEAERESAHVSSQVLDRERVQKTPGTHDDPFRLLQALPGVASTPEYSPVSGDVSLRGAAPGESRFLLDGVELPYLYHFHQYASVLHTRLLDKVAVYPSAFSAAYGEAVGGVVAAKSRTPEAGVLHGGGTVNLIMAGGYLLTPMGETNALSVSGRRSYLDLVESSNDQYTLWPEFWDYLSRTQHELAPTHDLTLTLFGAGDHYGRYVGDTAQLNPLEQAENDAFEYQRQFHAAMARSRLQLNRGTLDTSLAVVTHDWRGALTSAHQDQTERYLVFRQEASLFHTDRYQLSLGMHTRTTQLDRMAETDQVWTELEKEAPMLARGVDVDERLSNMTIGAWMEPTIQWHDARIQPGVRLQGDLATREFGVEPRATVHASISPAIRLRAGLGRYSQAPPLETLSPTTGDPSLGRMHSNQAALGLDLLLAQRWELGAEAWGRSLQDSVVTDIGVAPEAVDGWASGLEFTSRYRLREVFFSWVSLTVARAEREDAPFDYDQPYAFNFVASYDPRPGWNVGLRFRAASGLPYTPVASSIYDGTTDSYTAVPGEVNSARLPDYKKVDIHLERAVSFPRWTLSMYSETWWVLPGGNVLYPAYSFDYSEQGFVAGPSFLPLVGLRAEL